ncbi:hypothetical protein OE766_03555 [Pararhizobium sp. YC-54]|uniref:hypothetical protein n=1 Tax=Pararhizobium sp. YC-54 TaxID=2986920 RepID=UPI0021F6F0EE|nr:hypothetical protein [Pararhizobium sp. YC-54]MCV9997313.1 hypothetical protein [Pararhizobium sp. YC-54]
MTYYAWTIAAPGRQDIKKVTTLAELCDVLRALDLPGGAPPEFLTLDTEVHDHGTYTHNEGSKDQWSLTWTKVDGETAGVDGDRR